MSWPQWPQSQTAPNAAVAPLISATPSLGQGFAHSSAIPPPPMSYTPTQYASMSAEQQYAIQQWQNYHQQYAQWHAQYGEQYQREMQAKLGINAPAIPYMPSVPQFLPQPPVSSAVPLMNTATSFNIPPPNIQLPSQPPPPPPPPPENDLKTSKDENTQSQIQPPSAKLTQNTDHMENSQVNENILAGFVRESNEVNVLKGNQSFQNKDEQNGRAVNRNREGNTAWQQPQNQDFHQRTSNQQQKFQTHNRPYNDRINDRKNFGGNNNRSEDSGYNKRKRYEGNSDSQNQQGNEYFQENPMSNQQLTQSSIDEDSEDKTPEEKAFDEQFQKWEEEFENWKKQNANHPDKRAYKEYEMKFEDCRKKLLERREIMKKRKLERRFQGQNRSHPYEAPQRIRQASNKFPPQEDKNISNLQRNSLPITSENQRDKEEDFPANNTPVSVNKTSTENLNITEGKENETNSERYKNKEANVYEEKESINYTKSIGEKTELSSPQANEKCLDFLENNKKSGGIPGLDLLPEEITKDNQSENNPLDEEVMEVIDLEVDLKPTESSKEGICSKIKETEVGKKEIPSLFAQKIEKPDLSPPIANRDNNNFVPFKQTKFEDSPPFNVQDSSNKRYDEMNIEKRNENLLKPNNTNPTDSDGNVAMLSELANALADPNVLALLNAALSNTNNAGPSNPQQIQQQSNISPWLPGQQPFGTRPLLEDKQRSVNIFDGQNQNSQSGAGNLWQNKGNSLSGHRFDNNTPWASGGFEGTRRNYENIFDKSFNENVSNDNDRHSFKEIRNIFDRNAECDQTNKRNIESHRRNFDTNRNRNPWNNQKDDDWGNNNKRGNNLNRNLDTISESSQGSDRFSDRVRDNEINSRDRIERGNKRNSRDRNKRSNQLNNRDQSRSSGQQNEDVNSTQPDSHRNPFLSEPRTSDDYFRPAHVIDYQNKSLAGGNSTFSGNNFRRNDILLPTKVVDYGHKPSNNFSAGNRPGFSKNIENTNSNSDEYFPMKTIDYGHASVKSTEINDSNKNSNNNNYRNFSDNNTNNRKYNKPKWNAKNARKGNQNDTKLDQHLADRNADDRRSRSGQNNKFEESTFTKENNKEKSFSQFSECTTEKLPQKQHTNDKFFTENIDDSDIDFTKDDFTEFSPRKQSPLRVLSPENNLIGEGREDSRENEEQLEEISEDENTFTITAA